ncbi:MAG TPA: hypothetical protein VM430_08235 [Microbacterium sp.]|jgi:hypothetical protein|nr:hypothetical protein [Microbacterium sp.]
MSGAEELAIALYAENEYGRRKTYEQALSEWNREPAKHQGVYLKQAKRILAVLSTRTNREAS